MEKQIGKFLLTSDKMNFMVQHQTVKKEGKGEDAIPTGEYGWAPATYHSSLHSAIRKMESLSVSTSEGDTWSEEFSAFKKEVYNHFPLLSNGGHDFILQVLQQDNRRKGHPLSAIELEKSAAALGVSESFREDLEGFIVSCV